MGFSCSIDNSRQAMLPSTCYANRAISENTIVCRDGEDALVFSPTNFQLSYCNTENKGTKSPQEIAGMLNERMGSKQKQLMEKSLINSEQRQYGTAIGNIRSRFSSPASMKAVLFRYNIRLDSSSWFGSSEENVLQWLSSRESGYPDLAHKLLFLFENGHIQPPKSPDSINLAKINGFYQKALSRSNETPTTEHSIFLIKIIYEQLYSYYLKE